MSRLITAVPSIVLSGAFRTTDQEALPGGASVVFIFIGYHIYNGCLLHDFVATLRLSALPSAIYFVLSKLAL